MRVLVRPEARVEMREAQAWYEQRALGLGAEFARAVDAAVALACRNPAGFPVVEGAVHRVLLRRFPFLIAYAVNGETVVILACFHYRRDPDALRRRFERSAEPAGEQDA